MSADMEPAILPDDGIGLTFEEVDRKLLMLHKTSVTMNDPIMMLVTICNVFLEELRKLHNRHNQALTGVMAEQTAKYVDGVKATSEALGETLAHASVEAIRNIFDSHAQALQTSKINTRWCAAIVALSAFVNVIALAVR